MLEIKNLRTQIQEGKEILKGINLEIKPGEVHAIMGPNGSGKSTLSNILAGREDYEVIDGEVSFENEDLLVLSADERAAKGVFMAFQYPVEIPGVNNAYFLRTALNQLRKKRGEAELDAMDFLSLVKTKMKEVGLNEAFLSRAVNEGFSGGEKKRNEILQMMVLEPRLMILDETDSGLDIDALQTVSHCVNQMRNAHRSFVLVTHYTRLLKYIEPDYVHVLSEGRIIKTGDKHLADELEAKGYGWLKE